MNVINTEGLLSEMKEELDQTTDTLAVQAEAVVEPSSPAPEPVAKTIEESLPMTMTEDQMRALIETANKYNPKNVLTRENTGKEIHIYQGGIFDITSTQAIGIGDGNKGYETILSTKVREAMMDKRVTDVLRNGFVKAAQYPKYVAVSAKLLLAMATLARPVYVHGDANITIKWIGRKMPRNIDPGKNILKVLVEYLQPLFQMGSYWLPATGLSQGDCRELGIKIIHPVAPVEEKKETETRDPVNEKQETAAVE